MSCSLKKSWATYFQKHISHWPPSFLFLYLICSATKTRFQESWNPYKFSGGPRIMLGLCQNNIFGKQCYSVCLCHLCFYSFLLSRPSWRVVVAAVPPSSVQVPVVLILALLVYLCKCFNVQAVPLQASTLLAPFLLLQKTSQRRISLWVLGGKACFPMWPLAECALSVLNRAQHRSNLRETIAL